MSTHYQITIKKIETDVPYTASDYKQIFSDKVWQDMDQDEQEKAGGRPYAYIEHADTKDVTTEILDQRVEDLDIPGVVAVVNGLRKETVE